MLKFSGYSYLIRGQLNKKSYESWGSMQAGSHQSVRQSPIRSGTQILATPLHFKPLEEPECSTHKPCLKINNDARTGMPPGMPEGAICVQRFDDSRNSAIHITYRISLRSSSMPEPRDPLLKVLMVALSRSDSLGFTEFGKTLVGTGPGTMLPGGLAAGPPKQQVK